MYSVNTSILVPFPILQTKRLTLRAITLQDAREIFRMRANSRVNQFIARPEMAKMTEAKELVEDTKKAYQEKTAIGWAGILRKQDAIIGTCGFNQIDYANLRAELGGEMSVDYWGKGLALEAVTAIVNFGFNEMRLHAIEAKVAPENRGAIFILEQLGFRKEAHFRDRIYFNGQFSDMAVYSIIRSNKV